jgi:outer membrane protein assembly factor BamB
MKKQLHLIRCCLSGVVCRCLVILSTAAVSHAADWPMWGGNPARTGVTSAELPEQLQLNWVLRLRQPEPAWHSNEPRVQFDRAYEPVVAGKRMFVGSMVSDRVTAYDTDTGSELWRFYTEGPVRLAPAISGDRVYFVCDDGFLYCLRAADGQLDWKYFGAPFDRKVLGNDRLTSIFPARGAPVVYDNTVYFATSVWPFMGVFIHAVNAATGEVVWTNGGTGSMYLPQQHDRPAFAGIAPQGYLVATDEHLLVAGGQTAPAILDRRTGEFGHLNLHSRQMGTKGGGGYRVRATQDNFAIGDDLFRISDGDYLAKVHDPVISDDAIIGIDEQSVMRAFSHEMKITSVIDRKGRSVATAELSERWNATFYPQLKKVHLKAGSRLYGTGENGLVAAVEIPDTSGVFGVNWEATVKGEPLTMIAADDKLFVSTDQGEIYCFAGEEPLEAGPRVIEEVQKQATSETSEQNPVDIKRLLQETGVTRGYGVVLGVGNGEVLDALLVESELNLIVLEPDGEKVAEHRRKLDDADLYGERVSIHHGDLFTIQLPPYLANLVFAGDPDIAGFGRGQLFAEKLFQVIRPYGGVACLKLPTDQHEQFSNWVQDAKLHKGLVHRTADDTYALLTRMGALPDTDDWTHQYGNSGNTVVSKDKLVKSPMGVLWFGGPSNEKVLPRHGHGPNPQVAGGRLYIEGRNMLRCVDVYTGLLLWEREFLDLGKNYDYTSHEPGAGAIGSNYVSLEDSVYIIQGNTCYRLDAATGLTITSFKTPAVPGSTERPDWGFLSIHGDILVGGIQPVEFKTHAFNLYELRKYKQDFFDVIRRWKDFEITEPADKSFVAPAIVENLNRLMYSNDMVAKIPDDVRTRANVETLEQQLRQYVSENPEREKDSTGIKLKRQLLEKYYELPKYIPPRAGTYTAVSRQSSQRLAGLNRFDGQLFWEVPARYSFRHNTIASGNGKVFAVDRLDDALQQHLKRRGEKEPDQSRIIALDVKTGQEIWSSTRRVFGTFLNYSEEHDVVLQAGSAAGDRALDEVNKGMVAYRGEDGTELWENDTTYSGPLMLHHKTIYSQPNPGLALDLLSGAHIKRLHPLSGKSVDWTYCREGGCNTAIGSEHLITFRSSAAGFFDLSGDGGTGNWGGFRSSCSSNLIPANGVLNAPDYTRTCTCAFQNRASLALVHMPEVDVWTFNRFEWDGKKVQRVGLNFGAPGDRRAPDGSLWLDFPSVGGSSPDIPVSIEGDRIQYFRQHPSHINGRAYDWVACSGVYGASTINIQLDRDSAVAESPYSVRLHFAEMDDVAVNQRVFDVSVQGQKVLTDFDVLEQAGSARHAVVKEFRRILAGDTLKIDLTAKTGITVICGLEIVAEESAATTE